MELQSGAVWHVMFTSKPSYTTDPSVCQDRVMALPVEMVNGIVSFTEELEVLHDNIIWTEENALLIEWVRIII